MLMKLFKKFVSRKSNTTKSEASARKVCTIDSLETRQLMSSSMDLGMNVNNVSSSTYPTIVNMLRDTGAKTVRLWIGFNGYSDRHENGVLKFASRFKSDGFDVMATVVPNNGQVGTYDAVQGYFEYLMSIPGLRGSVDRWQVGNEPDHAKYWQGGVGNYVDKFLKPAAEVLHRYGEKVVSAGPSWNPEDIRTMVNDGLLNYTDFVGYHPYRSTLSDLQDMVAEVKSIVGGKPLIASEWNVRGHEGDVDPKYWANDIQKFFPTIAANFYAAYYFVAFTSGTKAGRAGILRSGGGHNEPFYSAVKNLKNILNGSDPVDPPADTGGDTGGSTGNTATTAPKISGFTIINKATGKAIAGYSNISTSKTISLSSLPTRNIQILAIANASTGSVKVGFTGRASHTENNAPYDVFAGATGTWSATAGTYSVFATAYSRDNLAGTKGNTLSITLKFV